MRKARPCAKCPKWRPNWCFVFAMRRMPDAPSCAYGRKQMNNAYMAVWMRERRKARK